MKFKYILTLGLMLACIIINAQTPNDFIKQAETKLIQRDELKALNLYKNALLKDGNNVKALIGTSILCCKCGNRQATLEARKAMFITAKQYAIKAIQLEPNNAESNYAMSVAMGRMALISSTKDKVAASRDIKKYADRTIALNPNFAFGWHVLGRYNYELSKLNFAEKAMANLLLGGLPNGDIKTAITCYEKCQALDKTYITNLLDLAKALKDNKQYKEAKAICKEISTLPLRTFDDESFKTEAAKLLLSIY
jgi:tetratricopeptide (TPR) repeat protein